MKRIQILFPETQWSKVVTMLAESCGTDLPLLTHLDADPSNFDRLQFAVLKLSDGSLEQLRREIEGAHFDWRDTLVAAGFGDDVTAHESWMPKPRR
jgi:hypothetical protein